MRTLGGGRGGEEQDSNHFWPAALRIIKREDLFSEKVIATLRNALSTWTSEGIFAHVVISYFIVIRKSRTYTEQEIKFDENYCLVV